MNKVGKYEWSENYLLSQGYKKEDVDKFFHIDKNVIVDAKQKILGQVIKDKKQERKCLFLFGQPGCGKSTYMKNKVFDSFVVLDIDEFRESYPFKQEIVSLIDENHKNNTHPKENSKGRDFTNFTRKFIGVLIDELLDECISQGYNIALQKHVSSYKDFESVFKKLNLNKYEINVIFLLVNGKISWQRCRERNEKNDMILNTVAKDFHDNYLQSLSQTVVDVALHYVYETSMVNKMDIVRDEEVVILDKNTEFDYLKIKNYIDSHLFY